MGLFTVFKNNTKNRAELWQLIESQEELEQAVEASQHQGVVIFKHSTRCMISRMVLSKFESDMQKLSTEGLEFYYLDLLKYRKISNAIAEQFEVKHESPQVLVLKEGKCIYHSSHNNIKLKLIPRG